MRTVLVILALTACSPEGQIDPYAGSTLDLSTEAPEASLPETPESAAPSAEDDAAGPALTDVDVVAVDSDILRFRGTEWMTGLGRPAMVSGGGIAYMGMFSNVCEVNTDIGGTGTEYPVDTYEPETVTDGDDDTVVTTTTNGWHTLDPDANQTQHGGHEGIADARLDGERVVALYDVPAGCGVEFNDTHQQLLEGVDCPSHDAWAMDEVNHAAWLLSGGSLYKVTPFDVTELAIDGDLLSLDAAHQTVFTAFAGERRVSAWRMDGMARWSVPTALQVRQLTYLPARDRLAALQDDGAHSAVMFFDQLGSHRRALYSNELLTFFSVSRDGREFSFGRATMTDFFTDPTP